MEEKTFEEVCKEIKVFKEIKKHGLSLGLTFSKEEEKYFNLKYGNIIDLTKAKIIKSCNKDNK
jgi:hypothetical protein